jgi:hypothetical protein
MAAKVFFFQDPTTRVWSYGTLKTVNDVLQIDDEVPITAGSCRGKYSNISGVDYFELLSSDLNATLLHKKPITEIAKNAALETYANKAELKAAIANFFFNVGGVDADGYLILPNTSTNLNVRIGQRTGFVWAVDQELIVGGFSGAEGVGWVNITGSESS